MGSLPHREFSNFICYEETATAAFQCSNKHYCCNRKTTKFKIKIKIKKETWEWGVPLFEKKKIIKNLLVYSVLFLKLFKFGET